MSVLDLIVIIAEPIKVPGILSLTRTKRQVGGSAALHFNPNAADLSLNEGVSLRRRHCGLWWPTVDVNVPEYTSALYVVGSRSR